MPPNADQVEVTLLGPGYGECAVIHLGNGRWVLIDSCLDSDTGHPAALSYLEGMGVDPTTAVRLVLATHWHDDHIRGMGSLVSNCAGAKFCCSSALGSAEFLGMVRQYEAGSVIIGGSGVREINDVMGTLLDRNDDPVAASANKLVLRLEATETGHGKECRIWTLSPSDAQHRKFLFEIAALVPQVKETKRRCVAQSPNTLSVVTWVEIGDLAILLGGDLEETGDNATGWSVIVGSAERPGGRARIFKVPHHGSENAHSDGVWADMLVEQPFAILAPWNRGKTKRPSTDDVERIIKRTQKAYSTASLKLPRVRRRPKPVEKTLKERGIRVRPVEPPTGMLRLRNGGLDDFQRWELELLRGACHLSEVHPAA